MVCQIRNRAGRPETPSTTVPAGKMRNPNIINYLNKPCAAARCGPAATAPPWAWESQRCRPWRMSRNQTEFYRNQDTWARRSSVLTLNCKSRARQTTEPARIRQLGEREKCDPPEQGNFHRAGNKVSAAKRNFRRRGRDSSAAPLQGGGKIVGDFYLGLRSRTCFSPGFHMAIFACGKSRRDDR